MEVETTTRETAAGTGAELSHAEKAAAFRMEAARLEKSEDLVDLVMAHAIRRTVVRTEAERMLADPTTSIADRVLLSATLKACGGADVLTAVMSGVRGSR